MLHLGSLIISPAAYSGPGWRSPDAAPERMLDFAFYRDLALRCEQGKIDFLFFPDMYTVHTIDPAQLAASINSWPEPLTLFSMLAAVTERIGLSVTMSTTYTEPFHVARQIASLDHLSGGRASWNMVTSRGETEAHNFRNQHRPAEDERGAHSQEFLDVVQRLWDSWEDGAVLADKATGQFADPTKIHTLEHNGPWLTVRGPLNLSRPPQGHPVLIQAGASEHFRARAAREADVIFTSLPTIEQAIAFTRDVRQHAERAGRDPRAVKIMPGMAFHLGERPPTGAEPARAMHCTFAGSVDQIADGMQEWLERDAVDGFIVIPSLVPTGVHQLVHEIIPELQQRGIFRRDYAGATLREHLELSRPPNRFAIRQD